VVFAVTLFATIIGIYFSNREISRTVSQDLILVGKLATDMITSSIGTIELDTTYVSNIMDRAYNNGGMDNLQQALADEIGRGPAFISLAVAFPDGSIMSSEKEGYAYAKPPASEVYAYLVRAPLGGVMIDEAKMTANGQYVIRCYHRISNRMVFISTLTGTYFSQLISASNYGVYNAGQVFLVDSGRTVIAHTGDDQAQFSYIYQSGKQNDLAAIVTRSLLDNETESRIAYFTDENGTRNICAYTPIIHGTERWALFLTVPVSDTPVSGLNWIFIFFGLIILGCGIIAAIIFSKILVRPYIELNRRNEELVVLREKAEISGRAKMDFLANMSHEIRTPLNAIIGMTAIGKSAMTPEKKDYAFSKIDDASNHLLGVVNDVLDMSKIEANKLELSAADFDLENVLQKVANVVNFRIDERRQQFYINIDQKIPHRLNGDDQRLAQVIANLLSNAVKFTPEGGTIRLDANLVSEGVGLCCVQISVSDTGIGLSDEQKTRLFNSFEQADAGTSRKYGGTGLGLAISKHIVERMGGHIWVESRPGNGSKFIFRVCLRFGSDKSRSLLDERIDWNKIRLLVVDGNPEIREFFINVSANLGLACEAASGGSEAVRLVELEDNYDFYFIDWKLDDMDGIELVRRIRAKRNDNYVIILHSTLNMDAIEEDARAAGVDKFLQKPLFQSNIVNIINECIGSKNAVENIRNKTEYDDFSGYCVLIAEDVEVNREIVQALLEPTKIAIECAEDGSQALEMFKKDPDRYSIIFMDVQMPVMDGYESTRLIRSLDIPRAKEIPIIAMTANVFREDIEKSTAAGMDGHIGKPIDIEKLFDVLKTHLAPKKP